MRSLAELPITALAWKKGTAIPLSFKLHGNDGIYATLTFQNEERTLARVETDEGAWTLKHLGVMVPAVTLRAEGGTTNLAIFHPHALRHGKLQFADGVAYDWAWLHGDVPGGAFLDSEGLPLVRLHGFAGRGLRSTSDLQTCDVELGLLPTGRSRQALLAAIGWYLILFDHIKERDAVAAVTSLRL